MDEARGRHGAGPILGPGGGGADLISALSEDLLLQVLGRLRCARAAARTSLLSRRWRGIWTGLPDLIFRDVAPGPLLSALTSLQPQAAAGVGPGVSFLAIRMREASAVSPLLHAAASLSPAELHVNLQRNLVGLHVDLPLFHRATSIELHGQYLHLRLPRASGGFRALQKLSLSGCSFDLAALVLRCPCLRVLRVARAYLDADNLTIQSASLQELVVKINSRWTERIHVEAPMLNQLTLSFCTTGDKLSVSIVAPIVEKVSWECSYSAGVVGFGPWSLSRINLSAAESHGQQRITDTGEEACLQLSNVYVMSLQIRSRARFDFTQEKYNFMHTIKEHLVTDFSVLELYFTTWVPYYSTKSAKHVFGAFVLHLLGVHQIRTAIERLKIVLLRSQVKEECTVNCSCDEPKNWRSKNISLINLEEVEIEGFDGDDHEFDFLKVVFKCAPMLKRMVVRMTNEVTTINDRCTKIYDIFRAYPFVECKLMQC